MLQDLFNALFRVTVCGQAVEFFNAKHSTKGETVEKRSNLELVETIASRDRRMSKNDRGGQ